MQDLSNHAEFAQGKIGGAELLFNNQKKFDVTLPSNDKPWTIQNLLKWIKDNLLKERPEFFIQGDSVFDINTWSTKPMKLCSSCFVAGNVAVMSHNHVKQVNDCSIFYWLSG
ncbi:ubiquitin-related modifier 1 isoform X3 [Tachypleus tridentatus]|uniref:ubiquitin-related modifier 1 isoform X3 n=1 Tax=Tachypleus tridentatus TaxID=6853 RepID=UPI003FD19DD5